VIEEEWRREEKGACRLTILPETGSASPNTGSAYFATIGYKKAYRKAAECLQKTCCAN
jgi:hypothetical protein